MAIKRLFVEKKRGFDIEAGVHFAATLKKTWVLRGLKGFALSTDMMLKE